MLAILANSPEPVLVTNDGGRTWAPLGSGLHAESVRGVYASPDGWWAALDSGGLMRYDSTRPAWARAGVLLGKAASGGDRHGQRLSPGGWRLLDRVVNDMAFGRQTWLVATDGGLLESHDLGSTWSSLHFAPLNLPVSSVRVSPDGRKIWIVSLRGMVFSTNGGKAWSWHDLPSQAGGPLRLDLAGENTLLATARNGLYISRDGGQNWRLAAAGLPEAPVQAVAVVGNVLLASMQTGGLYISQDRGQTWSRLAGTRADGNFPVVAAQGNTAVVYAASATEGLYAVDLEERGADPGTTVQAP